MYLKSIFAFFCLVNSSLAISPEFNNGDDVTPSNPISITDNGWSLTVNHIITGLGNTDIVNFSMQATGEADAVCLNKRKNEPPGQNPVFVGTGDLSATGDDIKNGGITIDLTTSAPENDDNCCLLGASFCEEGGSICPEECTKCKVIEDHEDCPNGKNWNQYTLGITYTSIVLDAEVTLVGEDPGQVTWVQRLVCSFIATDEETTDVECEQCTLCDNKSAGSDCADFVAVAFADGCPSV